MTAGRDFDTVFSKLKSILSPYSPKMVVASDTENYFSLDTHSIDPRNRKPIFFGGVRKGKSYVSFYLMPIYMYDELLDGTSPELRKRMQGKSCFNFTRIEPDQIAELKKLTEAGFEEFQTWGQKFGE